MFEYKVPKFTERRVLTLKILRAERDLAQQPYLISHLSLSSGIVAGCELFEESGYIGVQNGIVKFGGRLYLLQNPEKLSYQPTDEWTVLKICFTPQQASLDYELYSGQLLLDSNTHLQANELELGRFKLKKGSQLRTKYLDFADMDTEYDTVNLLYAQQAAPNEPTLHPEITKQFAREAYPFLGSNMLDVDFCGQCLAHGTVVVREYIRLYLSARIKTGQAFAENIQLYQGLAELLRVIKSGGEFSARKRPTENKIMLV